MSAEGANARQSARRGGKPSQNGTRLKVSWVGGTARSVYNHNNNRNNNNDNNINNNNRNNNIIKKPGTSLVTSLFLKKPLSVRVLLHILISANNAPF